MAPEPPETKRREDEDDEGNDHPPPRDPGDSTLVRKKQLGEGNRQDNSIDAFISKHADQVDPLDAKRPPKTGGVSGGEELRSQGGLQDQALLNESESDAQEKDRAPPTMLPPDRFSDQECSHPIDSHLWHQEPEGREMKGAHKQLRKHW